MHRAHNKFQLSQSKGSHNPVQHVCRGLHIHPLPALHAALSSWQTHRQSSPPLVLSDLATLCSATVHSHPAGYFDPSYPHVTAHAPATLGCTSSTAVQCGTTASCPIMCSLLDLSPIHQSMEGLCRWWWQRVLPSMVDIRWHASLPKPASTPLPLPIQPSSP